MRCQVYIPKELEEVLLNDAKKAGVNVSEIIIRILKKNYKTKNSETLDYIALKDIVFKEIEEYISTLNINDEFELYDASETFRNIPMTKEGKPNVNRAKLGRLFGQSIGKKPFENPGFCGIMPLSLGALYSVETAARRQGRKRLRRGPGK